MSVLADGSPTVTIFADHGPLASRIGEELRARGAATHTISIESGWLESVSRALVIGDSRAGLSAVRDLCERPTVPALVVVLLPECADVATEDLYASCSERHGLVTVRANEKDLVARVADEVVGSHRT